MRAGFTDAHITLRSGCKNVQAIQPYGNICDEAGKQQKSILNQEASETKPAQKKQRVNVESITATAEVSEVLRHVINYGNLSITIKVNKNK